MEHDLQSLPALVRNLLKQSLDHDTFEITQHPVSDTAFLGQCLQVIPRHDPEKTPYQNQLISDLNLPTAAVVDRTADLDQAAQALVHARLSFKGRSPYAPDIILVNEFVKKDLLQALIRHSESFGEGVVLSNESEKHRNKGSGLKYLVSDLQRNGNVSIVAQDTDRAILDMNQRSYYAMILGDYRFLLTRISEILKCSIGRPKNHVSLFTASKVSTMPLICSIGDQPI